MAPITQVAAAACFAALCSARTALAAAATGVAAGEDAYTAANLARRGKMTVLIPVVTKADNLVQQATGLMPTLIPDCDTFDGSVTADQVKGFYVGFSGESPNYSNMVQQALDTGLKGFSNTYPTNPWGQDPWTVNVVENIGYLLNSASTQIGCAISQNCKQNLLICLLSPPPVTGEFPFSKDYFAALLARTAKITDMSSADINPSGSGVTASVPSLLLASVAGFMALASI